MRQNLVNRLGNELIRRIEHDGLEIGDANMMMNYYRNEATLDDLREFVEGLENHRAARN